MQVDYQLTEDDLIAAPGQIIPKRWLTAKEIEQLREFLPTVLPNLDD